MSLSLKLYRLATSLAAPALPWWLNRRAAIGKEIPARLPERHGIPSRPRPDGKLIWVHAASLGETMSALPLIASLARHTGVLLTTGTVTSAQLAAERAAAIHQFVPLDVPRAVTRFLDHWRPDAAIFLESELWPNLLTAIDARGTPRFLFNARLSPRSAARWRRFPRAIRQVFGGFAMIAAQSPRDATRLRGLGLRDIESWGNLKFATPDLPDDEAARAALAKACPGPWLLAASTHAGEDIPVIEAHRALRVLHPSITTIIVPRHPHRADAVASLARGVPLARRSRGELPVPGGLYLADTIGELGIFYRLCPLAFIGGTLVPIGGHNMIEAAQLGCATIVGPHYENQFEAMTTLHSVGALVDVADFMELEATLIRLMSNTARLAVMGSAGKRICEGFADLPDRLARRVLEAMP
ncbi:MAG: 3-deoxy-D-manno-octulosonic acid transferase [Acidiphilium sp. 37-64-53]|uniref:3-deoxy-D-manno-octulosonic acid transferase n=1 Tax=Acidiphilium TaxID=522 RepID=UPI000BD47FE0|nr:MULTISPECIES: 3-deoxy-D-manno-octulosonic acid transferase [Acidiphilium]OYW00692.1 MAG: 3-deoxy-D-manno-octulosonic acid transferase [Acidiphilium sp. 37-64-53]OZB26332.1 MAG: 3-deoxy-D-manno-octulosonic acid transferase [Acidiphilium sp. 34-64-41]HQT86427.1 3-deoxy-D-manno-octulosonic acid transferase [Acidiphilium rubrum]